MTIIGEYIGDDKRLKGKTALLREVEIEPAQGRSAIPAESVEVQGGLAPPIKLVEAQFDDLLLGDLAHGWKLYPASCFRITYDSTKEVAEDEWTNS